MSVWNKYPKEQKELYIKFLQIYGALTKLFRQKKGDVIPYLDSKFQETVFAKAFKSQNVDIGNTPHDVVSIFGTQRIGIGLKTWMGSKPSFQKVMQLKSFQNQINKHKNNDEDLAYKISAIRNRRLISDYNRLGLDENKNIYHYITRDKGIFKINECAYPLIDLNNLKDFKNSKTSFLWSDGQKDYKYTFGDCQIYQKFDVEKSDTLLLDTFDIKIIEDPFSFLLDTYTNVLDKFQDLEEDIIEIYLPLYSYKTKEIPEKSGLNAWNASPKNKGSHTPRPLNEIYIPIPREVHKKHPDFFVEDIFAFEQERNIFVGDKKDKPEVRFYLQLPNGNKIPSLVTQDNMKGLQSGSHTECDESGKKYGQSTLGQWLLIDVLGLKERKLVTREWLQRRGTDCVRLWRKKNDYHSVIHIDFAPIGAFESFMNDDIITE